LAAIFRGELGRLAAWHLPGGPAGPPARWASTSNVEVGQTTYTIYRGMYKRREGSEGQSHKEVEMEDVSGTRPERRDR